MSTANTTVEPANPGSNQLSGAHNGATGNAPIGRSQADQSSTVPAGQHHSHHGHHGHHGHHEEHVHDANCGHEQEHVHDANCGHERHGHEHQGHHTGRDVAAGAGVASVLGGALHEHHKHGGHSKPQFGEGGILPPPIGSGQEAFLDNNGSNTQGGHTGHSHTGRDAAIGAGVAGEAAHHHHKHEHGQDHVHDANCGHNQSHTGRDAAIGAGVAGEAAHHKHHHHHEHDKEHVHDANCGHSGYGAGGNAGNLETLGGGLPGDHVHDANCGHAEFNQGGRRAGESAAGTEGTLLEKQHHPTEPSPYGVTGAGNPVVPDKN